jgi:mycothiol synthase
METLNIEVRPFFIRSASEFEYERLTEFKNILRREVLPDDPPVSCRVNIQRWQNLPDFQKEMSWAIWDSQGQNVTAFAEAAVWYTGDNEHLADFYIQVRPEYRRRGLARLLLGRIVEFARSHNRRLLVSTSNERVPASGAFLERIGGRPGLRGRTNQLKLSELDRSLIQSWIDQSASLQARYRIGFWEAEYPEEHLEEIAQMEQELEKDEPRDDLEMEPFNVTPDMLRQWEKITFASGERRWTVYAVDQETGRLAGYTQVFWQPERPSILNQGFTGVLPEHRGQGLGHWLKAEMMSRVLAGFPQVEVVRTGNANSNAPMLKINTEMGFKPYLDRVIWQMDVSDVEDYLSKQV